MEIKKNKFLKLVFAILISFVIVLVIGIITMMSIYLITMYSYSETIFFILMFIIITIVSYKLIE